LGRGKRKGSLENLKSTVSMKERGAVLGGKRSGGEVSFFKGKEE